MDVSQLDNEEIERIQKLYRLSKPPNMNMKLITRDGSLKSYSPSSA